MGLNLGGGGDFIPHIRWNAQMGGKWQKSAEDGPEDFEFSQAVCNLPGLQTGWLRIEKGEAPDWKPDISLDQEAPRPSPDHQKGLKVAFLFGKKFGDGPERELCASSKGLCMGIEDLYSRFEVEAGNNPGKCPVVAFEKGEHITLGKGATVKPVFKIVKWVDTPDEWASAPKDDYTQDQIEELGNAATNDDEEEF